MGHDLMLPRPSHFYLQAPKVTGVPTVPRFIPLPMLIDLAVQCIPFPEVNSLSLDPLRPGSEPPASPLVSKS